MKKTQPLSTLSSTLTPNILILLTCIFFGEEGFAQKTREKHMSNKPIPLSEIPNAEHKLTAEIDGIEGEALENVSARLKIYLRPVNEKTTRDDIQAFYQKAPEEIKEALKPFGYFNPIITAHLSHEGMSWKAHFDVKPGKAMELLDIQIKFLGEGANDPKFLKLRTKMLKKIGKILNVKRYEDAKEDLYELAEQRGYFQASIIDSEMVIDLENYSARIYILFNTGPRYHFGNVTFSPNPLSDEFLQRFVKFSPGDPYVEKKVQRLQQDLSSSNYFQKVSVEHKVDSSQEAPVHVELTPRKARQYTIGAGWGSDTKARALLGVDFRRLNPQGHQLKTRAIIASTKKNARATYIIPGKNPVTDQYRVTGSIEELDEIPGYGNNQKIGISYSTLYKKWHPTFGLTYLNENFSLNADPRRQADGYPIKQQTRILMPSFSAVRSESNSSLQPKKGYQFNISARGTTGKNGFLQIRADIKSLYSLSNSQRVVLRGSLASTHIGNIFDLPLSLQYFAGGPQSVRGYGYSHIGPGKYLAVGSAEFQQKIIGDLYLAAFFDVGSVNNRFLKYPKRSPGIGLVYLSPLGDIEISIATPLDKLRPLEENGLDSMMAKNIDGFYRDKEKKFRIQFSMGTDLFGTSQSE